MKRPENFFNSLLTEQQSLNEMNNIKEVFNHTSQLQLALTRLRQNGFALLPESRRLKIQPVIREKLYEPQHTIPAINLCGDWLQQAGFEYNRYVRIIPLYELLIICPGENGQQTGKLKPV